MSPHEQEFGWPLSGVSPNRLCASSRSSMQKNRGTTLALCCSEHPSHTSARQIQKQELGWLWTGVFRSRSILCAKLLDASNRLRIAPAGVLRSILLAKWQDEDASKKKTSDGSGPAYFAVSSIHNLNLRRLGTALVWHISALGAR